MSIADILEAAAEANPSVPIYSPWNTLVIYIPAEDQLAAVQRYADTMAPGWRDWIS